jgi:hypothetical protein
MEAEDRHRGIPPPGCTLPPTKYNPPMSLRKFPCRLNEAYRLFELLPYSEPFTEPVFVSDDFADKVYRIRYEADVRFIQ